MVENGEAAEKVSATDVEQKIIQQVEYYFGDANMMKDKFLREEVKKEEGWVTLTTLLKFNRLRTICDDAENIVAALKKSDTGLLEIREDEDVEKLAVRRDPERAIPSLLDDTTKKSLAKRTCYAKGFPVEATMDDLIEFFSKHEFESVNRRYDAEKKFKGSVFVLFKSDEAAQKFIDLEECKCGENDIIERQLKSAYFEKKSADRGGRKQEKIKLTEEMKKMKEKEEREDLLKKITHGAILKISGLTGAIPVEKIKEFFAQYGKVAWVDYDTGDEFAFIRYQETDEETKKSTGTALESWDKAVKEAEEGKVKFGEGDAAVELTASVLEGEAEEEHWRVMFENINQKMNDRSQRGRRGGRGGFRGGRGGFKRKGGRDGGHSGGKRTKFDDDD